MGGSRWPWPSRLLGQARTAEAVRETNYATATAVGESVTARNLRYAMARSLSSLPRYLIEHAFCAATRPLLPLAERRVRRVFSRGDLARIPIIINNRNRHSCMLQLIDWLSAAGHLNIWILDNDSSYPPLLAFYDKLPKNVHLARLGRNVGPRALYDTSWYWRLCKSYYVYTDPDVVPVENCPADALTRFYDLLQRYPWARKVGFGLKIDDLPHHYQRREKVIEWESLFWQKPVESGAYDALLDTTFALYRPYTRWRHGLRAIRTGAPYIARHVPWYVNSSNPPEEDRFYEANVRSGDSWWVGKGVIGDRIKTAEQKLK